MKKEEIETLLHFIERTGMHVYHINEISIESWIHGFEEGINNKVFSTTLKEYIELNYDIYGSNRGWPRQIELYSEKYKKDWNESFLEIAKIIVEKITKN